MCYIRVLSKNLSIKRTVFHDLMEVLVASFPGMKKISMLTFIAFFVIVTIQFGSRTARLNLLFVSSQSFASSVLPDDVILGDRGIFDDGRAWMDAICEAHPLFSSCVISWRISVTRCHVFYTETKKQECGIFIQTLISEFTD